LNRKEKRKWLKKGEQEDKGPEMSAIILEFIKKNS